MTAREVILTGECGHLRPAGKYGPDARSFYCGQHGRTVEVVAWNDGYRWRCVTKPCHAGGRFGAARIACQHAADRHHRRYPTHLIHVLLGASVVEVRRPVEKVGQIPLFDVLT